MNSQEKEEENVEKKVHREDVICKEDFLCLPERNPGHYVPQFCIICGLKLEANGDSEELELMTRHRILRLYQGPTSTKLFVKLHELREVRP